MKLNHLTSTTIPSENEKENKNKFYQISVYDGEYFTYCTPEATQAINDYMQYRERCGEKIAPNSPIIREQFERDDLLKVRNPRPIKLVTIRTQSSQNNL